MIYHVTIKEDWEKSQKKGYHTHPSLESDGFIHCSMNNQVTAITHLVFPDQDNLVLLCIDEKKVEAPVYNEDLRGHGRFPHIYGELNLDAVIAVYDLPKDTDRSIGYKLPEEIREERERLN